MSIQIRDNPDTLPHGITEYPDKGNEWGLNPQPSDHEVNALTTRLKVWTASQVVWCLAIDLGLSQFTGDVSHHWFPLVAHK